MTVDKERKHEQRKRFQYILGARLSRLGLPDKIDSMGYFKTKTQLGHVGLLATAISRPTGYDFDLYCQIRSDTVEAILKHTTQYSGKSKTRGLTWTASAMLREVWRLSGGAYVVPPEIRAAGYPVEIAWRVNEYGTGDGYIDVEDSTNRLAIVADRVFERVEKYAWPIFVRYGMSELGFLEFCRSASEISELFFIRPETKMICGMILARKLEMSEVREEIKEKALTKFDEFAKRGNRRPLEDFLKGGRELDLL